jgi:hypothetical protein
VLPAELSTYTPDDPTDMWPESASSPSTRAAFLTAVELPGLVFYESR